MDAALAEELEDCNRQLDDCTRREAELRQQYPSVFRQLDEIDQTRNRMNERLTLINKLRQTNKATGNRSWSHFDGSDNTAVTTASRLPVPFSTAGPVASASGENGAAGAEDWTSSDSAFNLLLSSTTLGPATSDDEGPSLCLSPVQTPRSSKSPRPADTQNGSAQADAAVRMTSSPTSGSSPSLGTISSLAKQAPASPLSPARHATASQASGALQPYNRAAVLASQGANCQGNCPVCAKTQTLLIAAYGARQPICPRCAKRFNRLSKRTSLTNCNLAQLAEQQTFLAKCADLDMKSPYGSVQLETGGQPTSPQLSSSSFKSAVIALRAPEASNTRSQSDCDPSTQASHETTTATAAADAENDSGHPSQPVQQRNDTDLGKRSKTTPEQAPMPAKPPDEDVVPSKTNKDDGEVGSVQGSSNPAPQPNADTELQPSSVESAGLPASDQQTKARPRSPSVASTKSRPDTGTYAMLSGSSEQYSEPKSACDQMKPLHNDSDGPVASTQGSEQSGDAAVSTPPPSDKPSAIASEDAISGAADDAGDGAPAAVQDPSRGSVAESSANGMVQSGGGVSGPVETSKSRTVASGQNQADTAASHEQASAEAALLADNPGGASRLFSASPDGSGKESTQTPSSKQDGSGSRVQTANGDISEPDANNATQHQAASPEPTSASPAVSRQAQNTLAPEAASSTHNAERSSPDLIAAQSHEEAGEVEMLPSLDDDDYGYREMGGPEPEYPDYDASASVRVESGPSSPSRPAAPAPGLTPNEASTLAGSQANGAESTSSPASTRPRAGTARPRRHLTESQILVDDSEDSDLADSSPRRRSKKRKKKRRSRSTNAFTARKQTAPPINWMDPEDEDDDGSEFVGRKISRYFPKFGRFVGTVTKHFLSSQTQHGEPLWHIEYEDGDSEDQGFEDLQTYLGEYKMYHNEDGSLKGQAVSDDGDVAHDDDTPTEHSGKRNSHKKKRRKLDWQS